MKIFTEITDLNEFNAWSSAKETKKIILENDLGEEFIAMIDDIYPDGLSETQLNDILWFESDWIFETLGIKDDDDDSDDDDSDD